MIKCLDYLMSRARKFTAIDFVFFKLTLLSAGILLGSYFAAFFRGVHRVRLDSFRRFLHRHNHRDIRESLTLGGGFASNQNMGTSKTG